MSIRYIKSFEWIYNSEPLIKIESINAYLNDTSDSENIYLTNGYVHILSTIEESDMIFESEKLELQIFDNTEYWVSFAVDDAIYDAEIIKQVLSKLVENRGILNSGNYVGNLEIGVSEFGIVVKSHKVNYDRDFNFLRKNIADFYNDLLSRSSSFYSEHFSKSEEYAGDKINYSEIAYIKDLLAPDKFQAWIDYLIYHPEHKFIENIEMKETVEVDEIDLELFMNACHSGNMMKSNMVNNAVFKNGFIPIEMESLSFQKTFNTQENRFVKFFLMFLVDLINELIQKCDNQNIKLHSELNKMRLILEERMENPFWNNISAMEAVPFNSQILQKKYPYNMIFQVYNEFSMSSKMNLGEVDKKFAVGQKDAPMLYQYWVFIMIFNHLSKKYRDKYVTSDWLTYDGKNLNFTLKEGRKSFAKFFVDEKTELHLVYNKTYNNKHAIWAGRSYSHELKPDISVELFKDKELVATIHFDAKYRLPINGTDVPDDINKMHAYKDGIIGTVGSYAVCLAEEKIIYHEEEKGERSEGLFPSVGACPLNLNSDTLDSEIANIMYIVDEFTKIDIQNTANRYSKERFKNYNALARKMMKIEEQ